MGIEFLETIEEVEIFVNPRNVIPLNRIKLELMSNTDGQKNVYLGNRILPSENPEQLYQELKIALEQGDYILSFSRQLNPQLEVNGKMYYFK